MDAHALGGGSVAEGNIGFALADGLGYTSVAVCPRAAKSVGQVPGDEIIGMGFDEAHEILGVRNSRRPQQ